MTGGGGGGGGANWARADVVRRAKATAAKTTNRRPVPGFAVRDGLDEARIKFNPENKRRLAK
jgi:hypothetical protein